LKSNFGELPISYFLYISFYNYQSHPWEIQNFKILKNPKIKKIIFDKAEKTENLNLFQEQDKTNVLSEIWKSIAPVTSKLFTEECVV
jgi:hypothetical protein